MGTPRRAPAVAAMDVGSSKVVGAVAVPAEGGLRVLALAAVPCPGVRRGAVVDLEAVTAAMAAVAARVRRVAGTALPPVLLGSAGGALLSFERDAELRIDPAGPVGAEHLAELLEAVRRTELPASYRLVHAITREYSVDGYEGCRDPLGMEAGRLTVQAHLVACQETMLGNLLRAASAAGLEVQDYAVCGLAAAEAVLTEEERRAGALVLDLGAGATQATVVVGEPCDVLTIPLGGEHITRDIAVGLRISRDAAEELKCGTATADARSAGDRPLPEAYRLPEGAGAEPAPTETRLAEIVQARVEEILELVSRTLEEGELTGRLGAGAVLTGGGSRLRGIAAVAMRTLGVRVRCGGPVGAGGALGAPESAACVGLLQLGAGRRAGGRPLLPIGAEAQNRPWPFRLWGRDTAGVW